MFSIITIYYYTHINYENMILTQSKDKHNTTTRFGVCVCV